MSRREPAPPVALFVHDRPESLDRTLACLRETGAVRLYVFSDGPRGDEDAERVRSVRERVRAVRWTAATVVERDRNLGLSESIRSGIDEVLAEHDRVVAIEDDVVVAPGFLEFVARCLDHYAADPRVAGVTGLRMPFDRAGFAGYPYDAFAIPRFFSWGWATWRRAWETFEFDPEALLARLRAQGVEPEQAGHDLPGLIDAALVRRELGGAWDVYCAASMLVNGQVFVAPTRNLVENSGLTSGTHFRGKKALPLRWEDERLPSAGLRLPPPEPDEAVMRSWRAWTAGPKPSRLRRLAPAPARALLRRLLARQSEP